MGDGLNCTKEQRVGKRPDKEPKENTILKRALLTKHKEKVGKNHLPPGNLF